MVTPLEVTARFALDGPWQPHGAARCRHAFVHAFRLLPPGSYRLTVAVRYRDGSKRLVPHGERLVTAPLERADMLSVEYDHEMAYSMLHSIGWRTETQLIKSL